MRLEGDPGFVESAFIEFERSEVGDCSDPDLLLNVTVKISNYSAADQVWIAASALYNLLKSFVNWNYAGKVKPSSWVLHPMISD